MKPKKNHSLILSLKGVSKLKRVFIALEITVSKSDIGF